MGQDVFHSQQQAKGLHRPDFQGWQVWKEVISNKETHEDPVVHTPLKVKGKGQAGHRELSGEVLKTRFVLDFFNSLYFYHVITREQPSVTLNISQT